MSTVRVKVTPAIKCAVVNASLLLEAERLSDPDNFRHARDLFHLRDLAERITKAELAAVTL